jgi:hypothetical protein
MTTTAKKKGATVMRFYQMLCEYLEESMHDVAEIPGILQLSIGSGMCWSPNHEDIAYLDEIRRKNAEQGDKYNDPRMLCILTKAFKDLTTIRNPDAMEIWHDLVKIVTNGMLPVHAIWLESGRTKERPDGSMVGRLHCSHSNTLDELLYQEKDTRIGVFENGLIFI